MCIYIYIYTHAHTHNTHTDTMCMRCSQVDVKKLRDSFVAKQSKMPKVDSKSGTAADFIVTKKKRRSDDE
jgi:hypothetical protein